MKTSIWKHLCARQTRVEEVDLPWHPIFSFSDLQIHIITIFNIYMKTYFYTFNVIMIIGLNFVWLNDRDKPAVTGIGCMKKVKVIMKRIKKHRDTEERVVLAIPKILCVFNAEIQTQLIYNFCFILTKPKFGFFLSFQTNFP